MYYSYNYITNLLHPERNLANRCKNTKTKDKFKFSYGNDILMMPQDYKCDGVSEVVSVVSQKRHIRQKLQIN